MTSPPYILVGNPENRRIVLFQHALRQQGQPAAEVVSYAELLTDGVGRLADLPAHEALVRIDSAGENFAVEQGLLRWGYERAAELGVHCLGPPQIAELSEIRGRILCPRQAHLGYLELLAELERVFADKPTWRVLNQPSSIAELFDKRVTSRRYRSHGLPVPEALEDIESVAELRAAIAERGWERTVIKISCSSSASCLAVLRRAPQGEVVWTTTLMRPSGWYNTLRVQRLEDRRVIDDLLGFYLREGAQVERLVPKARLAGAFFDCRVLSVVGEPVFVVVRQNRHPITNLHLGGWRGDVDALRARAPQRFEDALRGVAAVAALHPGTFALGADVLFEAGFTGYRILEANAFGDLLPGLEREGLSVYEWQIRQAARRYGGYSPTET